MRITYVTGCSCSGKTLLHDSLVKAGQPNVFELDDPEVPPAADVEWLLWKAREALHAAVVAAEADKVEHHVVTGIVWPFWLISSNGWIEAKEADLDVRFVLLDRPWVSIKVALADRLADWDPAERDEQIENNRRLQRALRYEVGELRGGLVVPDGHLDDAAGAVSPGAIW